MAVTAAVISAIASVAGATVQGVSNYRAGKVAEFENEVNAAQELEAQKQAFQEESLNSTQHYRAVRQEIAAGQNLMSAAGNIGTSAESASRGGYFNLAEDLSALRYKYGAEAAGHKTAALNYKYNAKTARSNRRVGVLASGINVAGSAAKGYAGYRDAGGTWGSQYDDWLK